MSEMIGQENLDLLFATEYPVASRDEAIAKSNVAYRQGDLDKALFYSVKALKFDPADTDMLLRIGQLHMLKNNDRMAARAFNLALVQDPENPEALQGLGLLYHEAGNGAKAHENLERAVAGDAGLWQSWNVLGILADDRGEYSLAAEHYRKALAVEPDAIVVQINLGYSRFLAGDYQAAARELYEVGTRSNHPTAWLNLGKVYGKRRWYDAALEVFLKVESEAAASNRTGELAMQNGDLDIADGYFVAAVRLSPLYFPQAEQNLAKLRQRRMTTVH